MYYKSAYITHLWLSHTALTSALHNARSYMTSITKNFFNCKFKYPWQRRTWHSSWLSSFRRMRGISKRKKDAKQQQQQNNHTKSPPTTIRMWHVTFARDETTKRYVQPHHQHFVPKKKNQTLSNVYSRGLQNSCIDRLTADIGRPHLAPSAFDMTIYKQISVRLSK